MKMCCQLVYLTFRMEFWFNIGLTIYFHWGMCTGFFVHNPHHVRIRKYLLEALCEGMYKTQAMWIIQIRVIISNTYASLKPKSTSKNYFMHFFL